ncbi:MAG TPA: Uma2 family endonuclease [Gemmataceae bacterium]|nr:Uma2 family endonuclease [Gemmataceae bacterium]
MTTATATTWMTADEFYDLVHRPENAGRWFELVRGEVIELPPPTRIHGVVTENISFHLGLYIRQRRKGYVTTNDAGTILERDPDTVRGPDVAYFTDAQAFRDLHPKYGEHPPLLAVEVLSPDDRVNRVLGKVDDYLNNGVRMVWLVDPEDQTVRIFRPSQPPQTLTANQDLDGGDVLLGFRCPIRELFVLPEEEPAPPAPSDAPPAS